jgi:FAD/FMN-containing dehydrogenase
MAGVTWTNWAGNQSCRPRRVATPADEAEVAELVAAAARAGERVRVAGGGHSFTPVVATDGLLLDLRRMSGIVSVDAARGRMTALAATTVREAGPPLWDAGCSLANQGDIDTQQLAGAIATATHGSGVTLPTFSGSVRGLRLITAAGEPLDVDETEPELLHAARAAVGMLGVVVRIDLDVLPRHRLRERIELRPFDWVMDRWDELVAGHRHFSFFWLPSEESAALYGLEPPPGERLADRCYVKLYDEAAADEPDDATPGARVDRAYRIYPQEFEPNFHELEYFVPLADGPAAVREMRDLMLRNLPHSVFPLEVRTTAADEAFLSPAHRRPTTVISVSGVPGTDYEPYLRTVDETLQPFQARVHWGKLHFLTRDRLLDLYPEAERFIAVRRRLDPGGVFLNDHLAPLFA